MARALGLDYGEKRIGIALSDERGTLAFPHAVIPNNPDTLVQLVTMVREQDVDRIVMGHSIDNRGRENRVMAGARALARALIEKTGYSVHFISEAYTSAQARRQFETHERTRKPKSSRRIDDSAAALILQTYLDTHHD